MTKTLTINHLPSRTIRHEDAEYLFFSGTSYLGIQQHPDFHKILADSMSRYGTAFGSSRNGNLQLTVYDEAEARLATMTGAGAALTLSSGMMAGQALVHWLRTQDITFVYGPHAHPAVWDAPVVSLPDGSFADWAVQLSDQLRAMKPGPVAVLVNSLDAVRSDYYSFDWIDNLPDDRPITLVVDDSHGLGVLNNGRGIWPQLNPKPNVTLVVTTSLAKAMGLPGGALLSDVQTIASLRQTVFFGACSPMPPAYLDAWQQIEPLYHEGRDRLRQNLLLAEKLLLPTGLFRHAKGYPVFYTEQDDLYTFLLEKGIFIYSFAYPTAAHRANTRIVISAFHELADIQKLAESVYAYCF